MLCTRHPADPLMTSPGLGSAELHFINHHWPQCHQAMGILTCTVSLCWHKATSPEALSWFGKPHWLAAGLAPAAAGPFHFSCPSLNHTACPCPHPTRLSNMARGSCQFSAAGPSAVGCSTPQKVPSFWEVATWLQISNFVLCFEDPDWLTGHRPACPQHANHMGY